MTKRRVRWKRGLAVAALCAGMALSGCASQKAGSDAPELPAKHWLEDVPAMSSAHEAMVQSRIKLIEAELELKLANLEWMYVANLLQERFLGLPATEIEK